MELSEGIKQQLLERMAPLFRGEEPIQSISSEPLTDYPHLRAKAMAASGRVAIFESDPNHARLAQSRLQDAEDTSGLYVEFIDFVRPAALNQGRSIVRTLLAQPVKRLQRTMDQKRPWSWRAERMARRANHIDVVLDRLNRLFTRVPLSGREQLVASEVCALASDRLKGPAETLVSALSQTPVSKADKHAVRAEVRRAVKAFIVTCQTELAFTAKSSNGTTANIREAERAERYLKDVKLLNAVKRAEYRIVLQAWNALPVDAFASNPDDDAPTTDATRPEPPNFKEVHEWLSTDPRIEALRRETVLGRKAVPAEARESGDFVSVDFQVGLI